MIGAIIGDIVGSRFEFNNTDKTDFELFAPDCGYTDDTICTVAIADAILNKKTYKNSLLEWCRKYPTPKGSYGASFARWIHSDNPQPYNSYGNGSAMRVSPVGWLFDSYQKTITQAQLSAIPSHDHINGIFGAECVAALIFKLRTKELSKTKIKDYVSGYGYEIQSVTHIRKTNTFNETCHVTIPQAISCFLESTDFENAIRLAVSIGGDSDTIAAITGSIAEAFYGVPEDLEKVALSYLPSDMIAIINQFKTTYNYGN